MSRERRLPGEVASAGLAIGPLLRLAEAGDAAAAPQGDPATERDRLAAAMDAARAGLAALAEAADAMAAEILEFQLAMLDDPALTETILPAIAEGAPATAAWRTALEAQVAEYAAAEDDYFRARAADMADLRDRVLGHLAGAAGEVEAADGAILLARDLGPSRFLGFDWRRLGGAVLEAGSRTSHVAMLARARGVPLLTGVGAVAANGGDLAVLDAQDGLLVLDPGEATRAAYAARHAGAAAETAAAGAALAKPAVLRSGERVRTQVNVDDPAALDDALLLASDGVGLMRTEFLFLGRDRLPDEDAQLAAYADLLRRAAGRPVTVRTLDVGGDKPLPGVSLPQESNPFLGLRGIRLCLERPALFRPQVRALLRAAPLGPLKVMLPMVAVPDELAEAAALFAAELAGLETAGVAAAMPALGIMVEVPAAAVAIERFDGAAFFSIGTNDLVQYTLAASRDSGGRVGRLADPLDPAVLRLIAGVVACGRASSREVGVCGDMASDPRGVAALLDLGVRSLSVAPAALGRVKAAVQGHG
ncbi:MAG: phosphoenolpyruvate--protein phosphotransferase [Geminicoccaceae bacterium]